MFDLKRNTTDTLYDFIILNDLKDKIEINVQNDKLKDIRHGDRKHDNFSLLFYWSETIEGHMFWNYYNNRFKIYQTQRLEQFKFLKV